MWTWSICKVIAKSPGTKLAYTQTTHKWSMASRSTIWFQVKSLKITLLFIKCSSWCRFGTSSTVEFPTSKKQSSRSCSSLAIAKRGTITSKSKERWRSWRCGTVGIPTHIELTPRKTWLTTTSESKIKWEAILECGAAWLAYALGSTSWSLMALPLDSTCIHFQLGNGSSVCSLERSSFHGIGCSTKSGTASKLGKRCDNKRSSTKVSSTNNLC